MENNIYPNSSNFSTLANNSGSIINTIPFSLLTSSTNSSRIDSNRSNIVVTHPAVNRLSSERIKQEEFEPNSNRSKTNVSQVHLNPRETVNSLSLIPMANVSSHLMSSLNSAHLGEATGNYYVPGLTDLTSSYKLAPPSNTDIPSPSSSSNSSNPPSSNHHQHSHHSNRRHGEGNDPTRKREMRLQKNREAARECRRKKKEYIKCLEERVAGLENQNKALIEELRHLKELYCQRDDPNKTNNNNNNNKGTTSGTSTSSR